jgi:acetyltransferase-like isoleucine patch superfamily enzyme
MIDPAATVADDAEVEVGATIGAGSKIWQGAAVRAGARVGRDCVVGRGVYIGPGVVMGDRCKIQNAALVYEPAVLADGVFIGPAVVLTNDSYPRAVTVDDELKTPEDWQAVGVVIRHGASIGARAVCVAPVTIGAWATVAAGAVVVKDVPDYALVAGVPSRRIGWVGPAGVPLRNAGDGAFSCPRTGQTFHEVNGLLRPDEFA